MPVIRRLLFVLVVTMIAVFFSEKAYWYPQGYEVLLLIVFYAPTIYVVLWAIDGSNVDSLSEMILVSAAFAFLVEGVITPVLYEGGILAPFMPAYFVGWHGLLSIVFGFYLIRRWLIERRWKRLLGGSVAFGLFWGLWSTTYWLPESAIEWGPDPGTRELTAQVTYWTAEAFGLYALVFTGMLMLGHALLSVGSWQSTFQLTTPEVVGLMGTLAFFYLALSFPGQPLGLVTLIPLLALTLGVLWIIARRRKEPSRRRSLLEQLEGPIDYRHLLCLLAMPLSATMVYAVVQNVGITNDQLQVLSEDFSALQMVVGGLVFIWALGRTVWTAIGSSG